MFFFMNLISVVCNKNRKIIFNKRVRVRHVAVKDGEKKSHVLGRDDDDL